MPPAHRALAQTPDPNAATALRNIPDSGKRSYDWRSRRHGFRDRIASTSSWSAVTNGIDPKIELVSQGRNRFATRNCRSRKPGHRCVSHPLTRCYAIAPAALPAAPSRPGANPELAADFDRRHGLFLPPFDLPRRAPAVRAENRFQDRQAIRQPPRRLFPDAGGTSRQVRAFARFDALPDRSPSSPSTPANGRDYWQRAL